MDLSVSPDEVRQWLRENEGEIACLFCGRDSRSVDALITQRLGVICDACIDALHSDLHDGG